SPVWVFNANARECAGIGRRQRWPQPAVSSRRAALDSAGDEAGILDRDLLWSTGDKMRAMRDAHGRAGVVVRGAVVACMLLGWCRSALALDPSLDISQYAHTAWRVRDGFSK